MRAKNTFLLLFIFISYQHLLGQLGQWYPADSPTGGTIQAMEIDGDGVIYGGSFDGLYKSTDNGENWMAITDPIVSGNNILEVKLSPDNQTIFVGGSYNSGDFDLLFAISTDAGMSWQDISANVPVAAITAIGFSNSGDIFAAGWNEVIKSTDDGNSWEDITSGDLTGESINDIIIYSEGNDEIIAVGTWNGVVFSEDDGETWVNQSDGIENFSIFCFDFSPAKNGGLYAGGEDGVHRYDRALQTWITIGTALAAIYVYSLLINPNGDLIAGTGYGIYMFPILAAVWTIVAANLPYAQVLKRHPLGFLLAGIDWRGLARSNDNGLSWQIIGLGLTAYAINRIFFSSLLARMYLMTNSGVFHSGFPGLTWQTLVMAYPFFWATAMIYFNGYLFAGSWWDGVHRTSDNGENWESSSEGLTSTWINDLKASTDNNFLFAATNGGGVNKSTDGGNTWMGINDGLPENANVNTLSVNQEVFAAPRNEGIFKYNMSSHDWSQVLNGYNVNTITESSDGDYLAGTDMGAFHYSTNRGDNWTQYGQIDGGFKITASISYKTGLKDDTEYFIALTENSVYATPVGESNWQEVNTGLGTFKPTSIGTADDGNLYIGTAGGGLFVNLDPTDIDSDNDQIPEIFSLKQNYPNPFNPSTTIKFLLPSSGMVNLTIHNTLGQEVVTLINRQMNAGSYYKEFVAEDLPSGIYIYRLTVDKKYASQRKMMLLK